MASPDEYNQMRPSHFIAAMKLNLDRFLMSVRLRMFISQRGNR